MLNSAIHSIHQNFNHAFQQIEPCSISAHFISLIPIVNSLFMIYKFRQYKAEFELEANDVTIKDSLNCAYNEKLLDLKSPPRGKRLDKFDVAIHPYIQKYQKLVDLDNTYFLGKFVKRILIIAIMILNPQLLLMPFTLIYCSEEFVNGIVESKILHIRLSESQRFSPPKR
jgi:hypothetical protein